MVPDHLAAIRGLAELKHRQGQFKEALDLYQRALDLTREVAASDFSNYVRTIRKAEPAALDPPGFSRSPEAAAPGGSILRPARPSESTEPALADEQLVAELERFLAAIQQSREEHTRWRCVR
ncbi:MAG: tetratricopeptide repeat protein [Acidobacteria bacterium]|nr:tetratricopeptide repeat protein [Acidobacteriota bacterium]